MTRTPVPPGYRAPDLYAIVLRSWIDALELRMLRYRRIVF